MAQDSRSIRRKRRIRRNVSTLARRLGTQHTTIEQLQSELGRAQMTLLMVLAQKGGEVTISKGTLDQVTAGIQTMGWQVVPGTVPSEFIVRLVTTDTLLADAEQNETGSQLIPDDPDPEGGYKTSEERVELDAAATAKVAP